MIPLLRSAQARFRSARMRQFETLFQLTPQTRILDVGGTPHNWQYVTVRPCITMLNNEHDTGPRSEIPADIRYVVGDARELPFAADSFDIAYSNSVIEHVGSAADQQRMAAEIARVGRRYYVQTPNRWFPVEPHIVTQPGIWRPLVHYLPRAWQHPLMPDWYRTIRLLRRSDVRQFFPDAELHDERVGPLTKSFMAVKR
jgi:hypothetical protein